jgi:ribosome-binding protein aMBF1 (putative translation factor)
MISLIGIDVAGTYAPPVPRRSDSRRSARSSSRYQRLVPLLREARERAGVSQVDLAERLGKPQSWVAKIEAGERRVDLAEFIALSEALQLEPVKFFTSIKEALSD